MTSFHIAGVVCPCGCPDLVVGAPGTLPDEHPVAGLLDAGTPGRAWCCLEHARADGWPWLNPEKRRKLYEPRHRPPAAVRPGAAGQL